MVFKQKGVSFKFTFLKLSGNLSLIVKIQGDAIGECCPITVVGPVEPDNLCAIEFRFYK